MQQLESEHKKAKKEKDRLVSEKDGLRDERFATNEKMKKLLNVTPYFFFISFLSIEEQRNAVPGEMFLECR